MRWAALVLAAVALGGCETTQEKSAKLEREAERNGGTAQLAAKAVEVTRPSAFVKVLSTTLLHASERAAVVVSLVNTSGRAFREVPVQITVKNATGATVYTNSTPGFARNLVVASSLAAHGQLQWIDDQVEASGKPTTVSAKVGEGLPVAGALPQIAAEGATLFEEPSGGVGARGTAVNRSGVSQRELVVYVVARRGGAIVAAGRAVLPSLGAHSSLPFQVFFVGSPHGAKLEASAPATTFG